MRSSTRRLTFSLPPGVQLTSYNSDFWTSRKDMPHPHAIFRAPVDSIETAHTLATTDSEAIAAAKDHAAANAKQRTMASMEQAGMQDSTQPGTPTPAQASA